MDLTLHQLSLALAVRPPLRGQWLTPQQLRAAARLCSSSSCSGGTAAAAAAGSAAEGDADAAEDGVPVPLGVLLDVGHNETALDRLLQVYLSCCCCCCKCSKEETETLATACAVLSPCVSSCCLGCLFCLLLCLLPPSDGGPPSLRGAGEGFDLSLWGSSPRRADAVDGATLYAPKQQTDGK